MNSMFGDAKQKMQEIKRKKKNKNKQVRYEQLSNHDILNLTLDKNLKINEKHSSNLSFDVVPILN